MEGVREKEREGRVCGVGVFLFCLFFCLVDFTFISFCFHPSLGFFVL